MTTTPIPGFREGVEAAAKWHNDQLAAMEARFAGDDCSGYYVTPQSTRENTEMALHRTSAAALLALPTPPAQPESEGGGKDAPIAASHRDKNAPFAASIAPSETASATSDLSGISEQVQRVVVWDEPLCLDPVVISAVVRATEADIIALQKIGIERHNYTDQEALADWMTVHGAWFESTPSAQPVRDVERVAEELDRYANFYKKHPDAPLAEGAYEEMRAMAQALRTANEAADGRIREWKEAADSQREMHDAWEVRCTDAEEALTAAEAEIARLRTVSKPFAEYAEDLFGLDEDSYIRRSDFRRICAALATPATGDKQ